MQFILSWFQTLANIYFAIVNDVHACLCIQSVLLSVKIHETLLVLCMNTVCCQVLITELII